MSPCYIFRYLSLQAHKCPLDSILNHHSQSTSPSFPYSSPPCVHPPTHSLSPLLYSCVYSYSPQFLPYLSVRLFANNRTITFTTNHQTTTIIIILIFNMVQYCRFIAFTWPERINIHLNITSPYPISYGLHHTPHTAKRLRRRPYFAARLLAS